MGYVVQVCFDHSSHSQRRTGNYLCDSPMSLFESMLSAMKAINPNPSFIIYTGDSVPHWLDYTSVEFYTVEMVKSGITTVLNLTAAAFPGVPIYPALGNHVRFREGEGERVYCSAESHCVFLQDNWLSDQLPPPAIAAPWLSFLAAQWSPWLPAAALQTVQAGGYYTMLIEQGLRLISWNSIYCDKINIWAALNHSDHGGQFVWLNQTLLAARQAGEKCDHLFTLSFTFSHSLLSH